ncbi:uncharacterized protein LOC135953967 [Calliphora vicina]|uniref:uncharacterized protein LOC135953967 n=1 Tax=Calliphora vicina TaxID=7373 RepID=UPI00325B7C46
MAAKLGEIQTTASDACLHINIGKTKVMRLNTTNYQKFQIDNADLEDVQSFIYLSSVISATAGSRENITNRIKKANQAFAALQKVWKSPQIHLKTKLHLFSSNVRSVLLYGCESWNTTASDLQSLQVFINRSLRKLLKIFWPNVISNRDLWERAGETPIRNQIIIHKWSWIGHVLRRTNDNVAKMAIDWNPQGSRRRGRPANTWRRQIETEANLTGKSWAEVKLIADHNGKTLLWPFVPPWNHRNQYNILLEMKNGSTTIT